MDEYDAINERNAARARAAGWPELTGTDAQLGWATTVRQTKLDEFDAAAVAEPQRRQMRAVLLRETSANVWIDNRGNPWGVVWLANLTDTERAATFPTLGGRP